MKRTFKPTSKDIGIVKQWTWDKSNGLIVEFDNGLKLKSAYTLPELLKIEKPVEVDIVEAENEK